MDLEVRCLLNSFYFHHKLPTYPRYFHKTLYDCILFATISQKGSLYMSGLTLDGGSMMSTMRTNHFISIMANWRPQGKTFIVIYYTSVIKHHHKSSSSPFNITIITHSFQDRFRLEENWLMTPLANARTFTRPWHWMYCNTSQTNSSFVPHGFSSVFAMMFSLYHEGKQQTASLLLPKSSSEKRMVILKMESKILGFGQT